ncbi:hypothetical protein KFU94_11190 [Chloroflexi bacterium TSY]|nr:hypothetical protein [Chloroflexi bacterium TSY]
MDLREKVGEQIETMFMARPIVDLRGRHPTSSTKVDDRLTSTVLRLQSPPLVHFVA